MINIHTEILDTLNGDELSIFCQILRHINRDNRCFPSKHKLSELTGYGRDKIAKAIKGLQAEGIIKTHQSKSGGKFSKTIYTITTDKAGVFITAKGQELEDNHRDTGFRDTEVPLTENPPLSIIHTLSINQSNTLVSESDFLEDFNSLRVSMKRSKVSNINSIRNYEAKAEFRELVKSHTREDFKKAIKALFNQQQLPNGNTVMFSDPKHLLLHFGRYLDAFENTNDKLYGAKPQKVVV